MAALLAPARMLALILAVLGFVVLAVSAGAQQRNNPDGSINPAASVVSEQELLKALTEIKGRTTLPDTKTRVLEQPYGRDWRGFQVVIRWGAAIVILGMSAVLALFYLIRGTVRLKAGWSGRTLVRFSAFERFVHWMTATCFIILALSGLNITFGRELLMPLVGAEAFAVWSQLAKYAHNYLSFPFTIGVVLMFLIWVAWNIPSRTDIKWIREGGGIVGNNDPPAGRFNAGEKAIFWIVVLGGALIAATGYLLMFPFYGTDISEMQFAQTLHGIVAAVFIAMMLAHIYIGTIGMQGAFEAMGSGDVDVNWARQHHSLWFEEEMEKTRVGSDRVAPAE